MIVLAGFLRIVVVPVALIKEQSGISIPVCPVPYQAAERKGVLGTAFPGLIRLRQARPMSVRIILVIPITGPASA